MQLFSNMIDYIKKEWNKMAGEIRRMKKRQLLGSAVNLGEAVLDKTAAHLINRLGTQPHHSLTWLPCCRAGGNICTDHMEDTHAGDGQ